MGYILPIPFTQYQEYQNRIKSVKTSDRSKVERVKRIYLSQKNNLMQDNSKERKKKENSVQLVYAELTGAGGKFDAKI